MTTESVTTALAILGVMAQAVLGGILVVALLRLVGVTAPWRLLREALAGSEFWRSCWR